ncbi:MAG: DUF192 domain-containing protein [Steroidobacteraceae bacterium]
MMKHAGWLLAMACLLAGPAQAAGQRPGVSLEHLSSESLEVQGAGGPHRFTVWIADDFESRARGLMFVREMEPARGMLFLFDPPEQVGFWMRNTYLSLDLLFIAPGGRIVNIIERARPLSLDSLESDGAVAGVLELLAGTVARLGIRPGDRVVSPSLAAPPES